MSKKLKVTKGALYKVKGLDKIDVREIGAVDECGILQGLKFQTAAVGDPAGELSMSLETIDGISYIVLRDCDGAIVHQFASATDPQASTNVYRATLTGANDVDPTVNVARNTLSAAIVWARTGEGVYTGTLTGAFTANKTNIQVTPGSAIIFSAVRTSANVITLSTFDNAGVAADFIGALDVAITVEP